MISLKVFGDFALFTDPITKLGGEKSTYPIPTYEAIKGILKSVYWKPTIIWVVDRVKILNSIRTESKAVKPIKYHEGGNELSIYTYLVDVAYQVQAHFIWNSHRPELAGDRDSGKHYAIAMNALKKGGRQDIFLGTRECQGYVEPCEFGEEKGAYDAVESIEFGTMYHSLSYPDENGTGKLYSCFWQPKMRKGIIDYIPQEECKKRYVRDGAVKIFTAGKNLKAVSGEE